MSGATFLVGDVFERLAELPDDSIDLVLTSPPFLALRSYLPDDHPDKAKEIGSEPTPAEFLDTLLRLTAEWERVLAPHGSIAVELGDTYAGSGGSGGDYNEGGLREGQATWSGTAAKRARNTSADNPRPARNGRHLGHTTDRDTWASSDHRPGWPLAKSLCGIPHLYHLSLAYGRNLLTGEPSPAGEWRVRNVVAWCRPNPAVGALGDKYRPATSYITIATKAKDRWFDLDAVRSINNPDRLTEQNFNRPDNPNTRFDDSDPSSFGVQNPKGGPPLDYWEVSPESYRGSHYATWPRKLLGRPIDSMCPREVCTSCGEPRRRIVEGPDRRSTVGGPRERDRRGRGRKVRDAERLADTGGGRHGDRARPTPVDEWSDCGCGAPFRTGIVLDPFAGSGTTLAVATGLGRDAIGIDLDERNADLARERVGMFLTVIAPGEVAA